MKLFIERDYEDMSIRAANIIAREIRKNPSLVLGLATGSTVIRTYRELVRIHREEGLDFSYVTTFNLDEYYGLPPNHPQSYHYFMNENLFRHINIKPDNIHIPEGSAAGIDTSCYMYDKMIRKCGGIDLQLTGIGCNGHIGFNEPGDNLCISTHLTYLTHNTVCANSRFFNSEDEVPRKAVTMGLGSIMKSKKILLLANGKGKTRIINRLLNSSRVSTKIPATFLRLHNDVIVIIDQEAAGPYMKKVEKSKKKRRVSV